jgi:hypothetical protein
MTGASPGTTHQVSFAGARNHWRSQGQRRVRRRGNATRGAAASSTVGRLAHTATSAANYSTYASMPIRLSMAFRWRCGLLGLVEARGGLNSQKRKSWWTLISRLPLRELLAEPPAIVPMGEGFVPDKICKRLAHR